MQESTIDKLNAIGSNTMLGAVKQFNLQAEKNAEQIEDKDFKEEVKEQNSDTTSAAINGLSADKFTQLRYMRVRPIVKDSNIGRNEPCPCGKTINGKPVKYKNCCLKTGKYETYTRI